MRRTKMASRAAIVLLWACSASVPAAAQKYFVTDLGANVHAASINQSGQVAGTIGFLSNPFLWSTDVAQILSPLPGSGSWGNNAGDVAGSVNGRAFVYSHGVLSFIGPFGSDAFGINNLGQVTGQVRSNGITHAFVYSGGFTQQVLANLKELDPTKDRVIEFSAGLALNDLGQIVGTYGPGGPEFPRTHGFTYNAGVARDLSLTYGPGIITEGRAVNNKGQITGTAGDSTSTFAFLAGRGGSLQNLGNLGYPYSRGFGINGNGDVVGGSQMTFNTAHAFLYADGNMVDLNELIAPAPGWELITAYGINDYGQIVGDGYLNGERHGFLLTPVLAPPANLKAGPEGATGSSVKLTWDYPDFTTPDGFMIERASAGGQDWIALPTQPASNAREFHDSVPTPYASYSYRMRAVRRGQTSSYSNEDIVYQLNKRLAEGSNKFGIIFQRVGIVADFTPDPAASLQDVAKRLGYDHFNWISFVTHTPVNMKDVSGNTQIPTFVDPPFGGYADYDTPSDMLPYYWDEPALFLKYASHLFSHTTETTGTFLDKPMWPGFIHTLNDQSEFITHLVGVVDPVGSPNGVPRFDVLATFQWASDFDGLITGHTALLSNTRDPDDATGGGVFGVRVISAEDLPESMRRQLIRLGGRNVGSQPKVDTDAPTTTCELAGTRTADDSYDSPVELTFHAVDIDGPTDIAATFYSLDGESLLPYTEPVVVSAPGYHSVFYYSTDVGGNLEQLQMTDFRVAQTDTVPPTVVWGTPTPAANSTGWNRTAVDVPFTVNDDRSGVASQSLPSPLHFTAQGAGQTQSVTVTDNAGNRATYTSPSVNIDLTPPAVSTSDTKATATSSLGAVVSYQSPKVTDDLSGISDVSISPASGSMFPLGKSVVTCAAMDRAGNSSVAAFTVWGTYAWSGFLQPINADESSVFKLGSTVPVKFQLTGNSANITDATARFTFARISDGIVGTYIEPVSNSAPDGGNMFRYDSAAKQYIYNWSTKGLTAGTYRVRVDLGDDDDSRFIIVSLR